MKIKNLILAAALAASGAPAGAVLIEGYTPSGTLQSVGVTLDGRFFVQNSTVPLHIIIDMGQNGVPVTVQASSVPVVVTSTFALTSTPRTFYPADSKRTQGCIKNVDLSADIYFGPVGGSTAAYATLAAGESHCPDGPSSFVGGFAGYASGTASGFYIYYKAP